MTTPTNEARVQEVIALFDAIPNASWSDHHDYRDRAIAALRSLAASATQVPQGWKLVPVEADDTMKQAGIDVAPSGLLEIRGQLRNRASWSTEECAEVYRAMIEKSPTAPQAATQGEAVAFDASKLKRYDYGYRSDEWGMGRALQTYPKADGPFVLYEDVVALAVINEPAPAPSKEQTNG